MGIIYAIIIIVAGVSLLFAMEKWNNESSENRNDLVFKGRNKSYGAFKIRTEYTRMIAVIIGCMMLFSVSAYGLKLLMDLKGSEVAAVDAKLDMTQIDLTPPVDKNE
ncbi:MAG TPA: hypothetical protein VNZ49_06780, partial [Bacteroidia bacterium]|nr:hypothetical protein [Bacteroidia bacterium]